MRSKAHGIILAGVHQWRPCVFERWVPRVLVPIANRRLVEYPMAWLRAAGVENIEVCANSDTGALRRHLGTGVPAGCRIGYYEDHMPRGPAGCVVDASRDRDHETLVVIDATVIPQAVDFDDLVHTHESSGAALTVVATSLGADNGRRRGLVPTGIYVFGRQALAHVASAGYQDIKEMLIPRLYEKGQRVVTHVVDVPVLRVTGAGSCFVASEWILGRGNGRTDVTDGYRRDGSASIHETASVDRTARLVGPVLVGPGTSIASGATIVGPTTIGAGCRIDRGALICRSILWDRSSVGRSAVLDRCILTYDAEAPADSRTTGRMHHRRMTRGRYRSSFGVNHESTGR